MVHCNAISQYNSELKIAFLEQRRKFQDKNLIFLDNSENSRTIIPGLRFSRTTHEIPGHIWTLIKDSVSKLLDQWNLFLKKSDFFWCNLLETSNTLVSSIPLIVHCKSKVDVDRMTFRDRGSSSTFWMHCCSWLVHLMGNPLTLV